MRFQEHAHTCGPAVIVNLFKCFGHNLSEKKVAGLCRTTKADGTDEQGLKRGLRKLGVTFKEIRVTKKQQAWTELITALQILPAILAVDNGNHWVLAPLGHVWIRKQLVLIIDSDSVLDNRRENGVFFLTRSRLLNRWSDRRGREFYALTNLEIPSLLRSKKTR